MTGTPQTTSNEDWTNRPGHLRQIADELDVGRRAPCTEAAICREAADEIEALRSERAMSNPDTTAKDDEAKRVYEAVNRMARLMGARFDLDPIKLSWFQPEASNSGQT